MPKLGQLGSRLALGAVAAAVFAVAVAAALGAMALRLEFERFSREQQDLRAAQVVASLADAYALRGSWAGADLAPAGQLAAAAGAALTVLDTTGAVVARTGPDAMTMTMPMPMDAGAMHGAPRTFGPPRTETIAALGRTVGTAVLRFPSGELLPAERDIRDALARAQWLAAIAAAVGAAPIAVLLARRITGPVAELAAAVGAMRRGERDVRVPVRAADELGDLARAFNGMAEALERADDLRRTLLGDVAHELRTPLATLQGHLEALRDGVLAADPATLRLLHDEATRLGRLVADLEALARAEGAGFTLERAPTDLAAIAREVASELEGSFRAKGVTLDLAPAEARVLGDADRLAQVARNLLSNALKFTPAGGHVRLSTGIEGRSAVLEVGDDGPGIQPADLPRVFERFWRGGAASDIPGSGVGLTIARELARAHGGNISASSRPGVATTFRVTLPPRP